MALCLQCIQKSTFNVDTSSEASSNERPAIWSTICCTFGDVAEVLEEVDELGAGGVADDVDGEAAGVA